MRTKHLLYTLALAGTFAACSQEDVVNNAPQFTDEAARPTLSGVTLSTDGNESRLAYSGQDNGTGGMFTWQNGDKIAAMMMDQNNTGVRYGSSTMTDEWAELTWLERYHLVDYVHTNYPFIYDAAKGEFSTDANMLEGNYFLVYPYMSFNGQRQAFFDISNQKQVGNTAAARMKAYGDNQHFVGYARLDATAGDSKIKAKMSEILAPVRINIESNCTEVAGEPLEVLKIVLTHPTFHSQYTIDPTTADYPLQSGKDVQARDWNLVNYNVNGGLNQDSNASGNGWDLTQSFNYANYLTAAGIGDYTKDLYLHELEGSVNKNDYVYNADAIGNVADRWSEKEESNQRPDNKYYYDDAIRQTVKPLWKENWSENTTNYVEVYTYDSESKASMTLKSGHGGQLGIIAMVPAFNDWGKDTKEGLELYIYTNKGLVGPVELSYKHTGAGADVQTSDAVLAADPRIAMNTVDVIIDDPDIVRVPNNKLINNTNDLEDYVAYLTNHATNSRIDITLTNDVTINDNLANAIKAMKEDKGVDDVVLYMSGQDGMSKKANLRLATTAALDFDILEWLDIDDNLLVQIENGATVNLTWKAHNYQNADSDLHILVDNGGTLNIADPNNSSVGGWSDAANFDSGMRNVYVTNNGNVNVNSKVYSNAGIVLTNEKGTFTVEEDATITLAPGSVNELNGTIVVEATGVLSSSINTNLANYGIIDNSGELYSVINMAANENTKRIIPGRVIITNVDALTTLRENRGIVQYYVLPDVPVEVLVGGYVQGMFIYDTTVEDERCTITSTNTTDLSEHHVTDAIFEDETLTATLVTQTTLRHLTLNNSALVAATNAAGAILNTNVIFAAPVAAGTPAFGADWNNEAENKNQLISNGESTFTNVDVALSNTDRAREQVIFNHASASEGITLNGSVSFFADLETTPASILMNDVLVVVNGEVTSANRLFAPANVASEIRFRPYCTWTGLSNDEPLITINKQNR